MELELIYIIFIYKCFEYCVIEFFLYFGNCQSLGLSVSVLPSHMVLMYCSNPTWSSDFVIRDRSLLTLILSRNSSPMDSFYAQNFSFFHWNYSLYIYIYIRKVFSAAAVIFLLFRACLLRLCSAVLCVCRLLQWNKNFSIFNLFIRRFWIMICMETSRLAQRDNLVKHYGNVGWH